MTKPFKTYRQQLKILRKRNLRISDGSKAISILRRDNYYNIINGYKTIFLDEEQSKINGEDYYKDNTTFENIYALFSFDREIKNLLIRFLLISENNIKSKISYYFSEKFKDSFSYLNISCYNQSDTQNLTRMIAMLAQVISENTNFRKEERRFTHYINHHNEIPLWVLCKKLTFGEISFFYKFLKDDIKLKIVEDLIKEIKKEYSFEIQNEQLMLENILSFLSECRNTCAHDERLFNTIYKINKKIYKIDYKFANSDLNFKSRTFDVILLLKLFVTKTQFKLLIKNLKKSIDELENKLNKPQFNKVLIEMGFSKNWYNELINFFKK